MCQGTAINQIFVRPSRDWKRRSADVGGLHLATENNGQGQGWMAYKGDPGQTQFAELLSDMYTETMHAVNEHGSDFIPTDLSFDTRSRLIGTLDGWSFEPHKLPDEEMLACTMILFEGLYRIDGMEEATGVSLKQLFAFVYHLRRIYRLENSYHNFEHALDVLQATYCYLRTAGVIPPLSILLEPDRKWRSDKAFDSGPLITSLGLHDLFVVYVAAIGHDVGHPGFTNAFMKNAAAPLSIVFDQSALEQLHCQLLLRVMRYHGLGSLLDSPTVGFHVRKLLLDTVLATDMSIHTAFMSKFERLVAGDSGDLYHRQVMICQALLKCADISNPSRPYHVSQHWASALIQEWMSQANLEKDLDLPPTVLSSDDPLSEAKSQVGFITMCVKPLLDLTVAAIPEMQIYADECTQNLRRWSMRRDELELDTPTMGEMPRRTASPRHLDSYSSAFPLTLPNSHRFHHAEDVQSGPWPLSYSHSRSSDSSGESSDSAPCSPCDSISSFVISPASETSGMSIAGSSVHSHGLGQGTGHGHGHIHVHVRPPSSAGSNATTTSGLTNVSQVECHNAIRAAGQLGIRKQKSVNRNSWSPFSYSASSVQQGQGQEPPQLSQRSPHPLYSPQQQQQQLHQVPVKQAVTVFVAANAPGAISETILLGTPIKVPRS